MRYLNDTNKNMKFHQATNVEYDEQTSMNGGIPPHSMATFKVTNPRDLFIKLWEYDDHMIILVVE